MMEHAENSSCCSFRDFPRTKIHYALENLFGGPRAGIIYKLLLICVYVYLHFGSIWHPNWPYFAIIFRFSFWTYFRCVFFGKLQHFRSRTSSILVLSPTRGAIFRVFIKLQTKPKRTQNLSKMADKINQKTF